MLKKVLSQPYPYLLNSKRNYSLAFIIGLIIYAFNFLLADPDKTILSKQIQCVIAGFITFFSILLVTELGPRLLLQSDAKERWSVGKEVLLVILILLAISFFNNLVFSIIQKESLNDFLTHFTHVFLYVIGLGTVPILLVIWLNYTVTLRRNLNEVSLYNKQLKQRAEQADNKKDEHGQVVVISTQNKNEVIHLNLNEFLFAKSEGNYVDIVTRKDGTVRYFPYRLSIQQLATALEIHSFVMSPHRSYLINLKNIAFAEGNARNYKLAFEGVIDQIPVSRTKFKTIKQALEKEEAVSKVYRHCERSEAISTKVV